MKLEIKNSQAGLVAKILLTVVLILGAAATHASAYDMNYKKNNLILTNQVEQKAKIKKDVKKALRADFEKKADEFLDEYEAKQKESSFLKYAKYLDLKEAAQLLVYRVVMIDMLSEFFFVEADINRLIEGSLSGETDEAKIEEKTAQIYKTKEYINGKKASNFFFSQKKIYRQKCKNLIVKSQINKLNKNFKRNKNIDFPKIDLSYKSEKDALKKYVKLLETIVDSFVRWEAIQLKYGANYKLQLSVRQNFFDYIPYYHGGNRGFKIQNSIVEEVVAENSKQSLSDEFYCIRSELCELGSCFNYAKWNLNKKREYNEHGKVINGHSNTKSFKLFEKTKIRFNKLKKAHDDYLEFPNKKNDFIKQLKEFKKKYPFKFFNYPRKYKKSYLEKVDYKKRLEYAGELSDCYYEICINICDSKPRYNGEKIFKELKLLFDHKPCYVIPLYKELGVMQVRQKSISELQQSYPRFYRRVLQNGFNIIFKDYFLANKKSLANPLFDQFDFDPASGLLKTIYPEIVNSGRRRPFGISSIEISDVSIAVGKDKFLCVMKNKIRGHVLDYKKAKKACEYWSQLLSKKSTGRYTVKSKFILPSKDESFIAEYDIDFGECKNFKVCKFDKAGKLTKTFKTKEELMQKTQHPFAGDKIHRYGLVLDWLKQCAKTGKKSRSKIFIPEYDNKTGQLKAIDVYSKVTGKILYRREFEICKWGKAIDNNIKGAITLPAGLNSSKINRVEITFYDRRDSNVASKFIKAIKISKPAFKDNKLTFKQSYDLRLRTLEDKEYQGLMVIIYAKKNKNSPEEIVAVNDGLIQVKIIDNAPTIKIKTKLFE